MGAKALSFTSSKQRIHSKDARNSGATLVLNHFHTLTHNHTHGPRYTFNNNQMTRNIACEYFVNNNNNNNESFSIPMFLSRSWT